MRKISISDNSLYSLFSALQERSNEIIAKHKNLIDTNFHER
jgi:hypothetical protein